MTDLQSLTIDYFVPRPPARVWHALTTPEELAQWWAPGNIRPTVGHEFTMQMPGWGNVACRVLEVDEPSRLVYTFADWTLTWQLNPEGSGTRLTLVHSGFDMEKPHHRTAFENMGKGWGSAVLPRLSALVERAA